MLQLTVTKPLFVLIKNRSYVAVVTLFTHPNDLAVDDRHSKVTRDL